MKASTVLLIVNLSLACYLGLSAAKGSPAPASTASSEQYDADSYEAHKQKVAPAGTASKQQNKEKEPKPYELCPDPQPADSVKQAHLGHGTFNWEELARAYEPRQSSPAKAKVMSEDGWPSAAVKAAFNIDRRPTRDHKTTAAVNDAKQLFPSKVKELDGFLGAYDPERSPTYEGLAVGPHPYDPDMVFLLHAVNGVAQMFLTDKDGTPSDLNRPTKIDLAQMQAEAGFSLDATHPVDLEIAAVTAFYDPKAKRYAIVWSTISLTEDVGPPVFLAVSQSRNPLGDWTVWALDLRPTLAQGLTFCHDHPANAYVFDFPQVSFSLDGLFIGGSSSCPSGGEEARISLAALYVLPKDALFSPPPSDPEAAADITAAVYITRNSWYRSVTPHELSLTPDAFEPFNSIPAPARPQALDDMHSKPLFVMKVDNAHLSVATLTDEPISKMNSIDSAPKILAVVVGKGDAYAAADGFSDGKAVMPQPDSSTDLQLDYIGMPHTYNGLVFWATQHKGFLYVATGEYWGYDYVRMPSIYWAIIKSTDNLCELTRKDHGLIASQDGLALAYPVIAAREGGGALVAFSYSGKGGIAGGKHPAFPGVATAMVGRRYVQDGKDNGRTVIHIIKKGTASLKLHDDPSRYDSIPWGIGSAGQVCGDNFWFAVPIPAEVPNNQNLNVWYGSWVTWQQL